MTGRERGLRLGLSLSLVVVFGSAPAAQAQQQPTNVAGQGAPAPGEGQPAGDAPQGALGASALSKLPKQIKFVEAEYPKEAAAQGVEADVILLLDIGVDGKVGTVGLAEPSGTPGMGFEEAALAAAPGFEFEPAEQDGKPIAVQITYRYKFRLTAKPPAAAEPQAPGAPAPPPVEVGNLAGVLVERGTRLPVPGVVVTVFRDQDGAPVGFEATSDAEGHFAFKDLAAGDWKVSIEAPGYYPFKTGEQVAAREGIEVTYHLERGSYNPYDVTVSAQRPRKEVSRTVLSAAEIDKVPGTAGDPLNVVQNFPGVARSGFDTQGQFIVRGSSPEDSRIFVDGGEVPLIYHFGGIRGVLPIGVLDRLDFYPGNFAPEFGRATGGIIDVRVKKLAPKRVGGYADISLLDTSVFLEVPLGEKGAIAVGGRRSYIDAIVNAAVPDDADVAVVTAPVYYDFQLLANYRPAPAHDLRAFVFGSDDRLALLFANPADLDPKLTSNNVSASSSFYRTQLSYRYTPSAAFENTMQVSQGRNWSDFSLAQLNFHFDVYSAQVRDTVRHNFGERWALSYGVDVLFARGEVRAYLPPRPQEGQPQQPGIDLDEIIFSSDRRTFLSPAAFLSLELKPVDGLLVLPGVRVDRFDLVDEVVVQPRLTVRFEFMPGVTLKGGVGLFSKAPEFDEINADFGNPDLRAERAVHYSAGFEYKPEPYLLFDITGFYKDMTDLVSPTDRVVVKDGMPSPLRLDNGGKGRVYGTEITVRHEFANGFTGWLAYTLSRAERQDSGATGHRLFDFDQTHILTAVGSYELPRNWQIGFRYRVVSGNPRTPITSAVFDATDDEYRPLYGPVNSDRNGLFHQLDLRVDKRWIFEGWMLTAYLDIQNVYAHEHDEGRSYNYDFSRYERQSGLPILPILGVRAEF